MSNLPVQFKRKPKPKTEPLPLAIDDEVFLFKPELGSQALEPVGRLNEDGVGAMFEAIRALMVERPDDDAAHASDEEPPLEKEGSSFRRFVALDLDAKTELPPVFELIFGLYEVSPGESPASSTSSDDDEANSTPTSPASTRSTSTKLKSA